MKLVVKNKKINIIECNRFFKRFVSFKFKFETIDYGLYFPHKKSANTYLFCQKVDLCFTDKNQKILYLYKDVPSEQVVIHLKAKNVWILPLGTVLKLNTGDTLKIEKKEID